MPLSRPRSGDVQVPWSKTSKPGVAAQGASGLYGDFVSVLSDVVPTPVEAVAPGHEIAAEFAYEMHYLARGLSRTVKVASRL